jgi:hypothetical protein
MMSLIDDLGHFLVPTQIGVRLKVPHNGAVRALDYSHISGWMDLQHFVVVNIRPESPGFTRVLL